MSLADDWHSSGESLDEGMGTPAQVGGNEWKADIAECRVIKYDLRLLVKKLLEHGYDKNILTQMALSLGDMDDILNRLENIGRNTK